MENLAEVTDDAIDMFFHLRL